MLVFAPGTMWLHFSKIYDLNILFNSNVNNNYEKEKMNFKTNQIDIPSLCSSACVFVCFNSQFCLTNSMIHEIYCLNLIL